MITKLLDRLLAGRKIFNCDRDIYLHRWYVVRRPSIGIFIHKFVRSDEDRALHDHPWNFIVIPIWRGYIEHGTRRSVCNACEGTRWRGPSCAICDGSGWCDAPIKRRVLPILGTRFRQGTYKHRVELFRETQRITVPTFDESAISCVTWDIELPSWSIFIRFKKFRVWGFHLPSGWMAWDQWWSEKCE